MTLAQQPLATLTTFTRAGSATYFDSAGALATAPVDSLRQEYDPATGTYLGALIEPAETQLLQDPATLDTANWPSSNLLPTTLSGGQWAVTEDATTGSHFLRPNYSFVAGQRYTASVDVAGNGRDIRISFSTSAFTNFTAVAADLVTGTATLFGATAGVDFGAIDLGGGKYRVWMSKTADMTAVAAVQIALFDGANTNYAGDGTSGVLITRVQLGTLPYPTSFIDTGGATRAADALSVPAANLPTIGASGFTLLMRGDIAYADTSGSVEAILASWAADANNRVDLRLLSNAS